MSCEAACVHHTCRRRGDRARVKKRKYSRQLAQNDQESNMAGRKISLLIVAVVVLLFDGARAQQPAQSTAADPATVAIDDKSIGGVVASRFGPEAGVWVIAETKDLGTVTDERGRYVIPDLPKAN